MSKIRIGLEGNYMFTFEIEDFQKFYTELILAKNPEVGSGYVSAKDINGKIQYINVDKIVMIEVEKCI